MAVLSNIIRVIIWFSIIGTHLITEDEPWESASAMTLIISTSLSSSYLIIQILNIRPELRF